MKLTTYQRKLAADQLRACIPHLWNGERDKDGNRANPHQHEFICHALSDANANEYVTLASEVILSRLGRPKGGGLPRTVQCWLSQVAKIPAKELTQLELQRYRHRWVHELIREFSE